MRNTATAYNLAQFAPQERRQPGVRVVRTSKKNNARRAFKVKCAAYLVVLVALMVGTLVSQLKLTEIEGQITQTEKKITEMESQNAYLNYQINNSVALTNMENYARDELGMVAVGQGQIEYVSLSEGNQITSYMEDTGGLQDFLSGIVQFFFGK